MVWFHPLSPDISVHNLDSIHLHAVRESYCQGDMSPGIRIIDLFYTSPAMKSQKTSEVVQQLNIPLAYKKVLLVMFIWFSEDEEFNP